MNTFWPHQLKYQGNVNSILTLDNCTAHDMKPFLLPNCLGIKSLPPNVTSRHQPGDMGMIESLKVGYKSWYLRKLLECFDTPGGFDRAAIARKQKRR